jgi:antitoxin component YwqK of YwqJK toxin-antitoxin module
LYFVISGLSSLGIEMDKERLTNNPLPIFVHQVKVSDMIHIRIIAGILFTFTALFGYCQISDMSNQVDEKGRKQGFWRQMDEQGRIRYEGQFKDDVPYGEFKYFYDDGNLKALSVISDQGARSYTKTYHRNGRLMSEGLYVDQLKDSVWKYLDARGNLLTTETYEAGLKHGESKTYEPDGRVSEIVNYVNDEKDGTWKQFFRNGNLKLHAHYKKGLLHGEAQYYFLNGNVSSNGAYNNGVKDGEWNYYDEKGAPTRTETWKDGRMVDSVKHGEE